MPTRLLRPAWCLLLALLLAQEGRTAPDAPVPTLVVGLEHQVHRHPQPRATLVFENGLGLTLGTWQKVLPALSDCCQWLVYNRPGIGHSTGEGEPPPADTPDTPAQLQRLLQALQLPPPYVLVGHSLGGQHAQRFAQRYPGQVAGLVLVDALPLGIARPYDDFPWYTRLGLRLFAAPPLRREIAAIHPMGEALIAGPCRFAGPMVRLVAQDDAPKAEGLLKDLAKGVVYAEDFGIWAMDTQAAEARMSQLYPQAETRLLRGHHRLQEQAPEQVVAAILDVLAQLPATPSAAPTAPDCNPTLAQR